VLPRSRFDDRFGPTTDTIIAGFTACVASRVEVAVPDAGCCTMLAGCCTMLECGLLVETVLTD
jgi:hypothetical protein